MTKYLGDIDDNNLRYLTTIISFWHPLRLDDQSFKNGTWVTLNEWHIVSLLIGQNK